MGYNIDKGTKGNILKVYCVMKQSFENDERIEYKSKNN